MSNDKVNSGSAQKKSDADSWTVNILPSRIETLVDGVFAIAMTIIVLELSVPYLGGGGHAVGENVDSLGDFWMEFYAYYMSFIALGVYWILHHYIFHFIKRSDGIFVWLNIHFLIFAVMVPFSFRLNLANLGNPTVTVITSVFFILTLSFLIIILRYATWNYKLVDRDIDKRTIYALNYYMLIAIIIMAMSIGVAYINYSAASLISLAVLIMLILATAHAKHRSGSSKTINRRK